MNELITLKNYIWRRLDSSPSVGIKDPITWDDLLDVLSHIEFDTQDIRDRRQVLLTELMNHCEARKTPEESVKYAVRMTEVTDSRMYNKIPVAEAKLVFVKEERRATVGAVIKPILVSETEKIGVGDWIYDTISKEITEALGNGISNHYKKILALPEHFSPAILQMIIDGKLKDGDKVLVECDKVFRDINGNQLKNIRINTPTLLHENEKAELMASMINYQVKLDSSNYVTLHKIEDKIDARHKAAGNEPWRTHTP